MVSVNGNVKVLELSNVIKVAQEEFVRQQEQSQQTDNRDTVLEEIIENQKIKEQEIKERLEKINFDEEISFEDKLFIAKNLGTILRTETIELQKKCIKATSTGLSQYMDEYLNILVSNNYYNVIVNGGEVNLNDIDVDPKVLEMFIKLGYTDKNGVISKDNLSKALKDRETENQIVADISEIVSKLAKER